MVSLVGQDIHPVLLCKPYDLLIGFQRQEGWKHDFSCPAVGDHPSIKGKDIASKAGQLQLPWKRLYPCRRPPRCKYYYFSCLLGLHQSCPGAGRNFFLPVCQCPIQIKYNYFIIHMYPLSNTLWFLFPGPPFYNPGYILSTWRGYCNRIDLRSTCKYAWHWFLHQFPHHPNF